MLLKKRLMAAAVVSACAGMSSTVWADDFVGNVTVDGIAVVAEGGRYSNDDDRVFEVINGGTLTNSGPLTVVGNTVSKEAISVTGIGSRAELTDTAVINNGRGVYAHGLTVAADAEAILRNVSISTIGNAGFGLDIKTRALVQVFGGDISTLGQSAYGVIAQWNSQVHLDGVTVATSGKNANGVNIAMTSNATVENSELTTTGQEAHAILVNGNSQIDVFNSKVLATGVSSNALFANSSSFQASASSLHSEQAAAIRVNGVDNTIRLSDGSQVTSGINVLLEVDSTAMLADAVTLQFDTGARGIGDIVDSNTAATAAVVNVGLSHGAEWQGATQAVDKLSIDSGAQWAMTGDSAVNVLSLDDGRVVFGDSDGFKTLSLQTLSGTGQFYMRIDPSTASADTLTVSDSASGNHQLIVRGNGREPANDEALQLVRIASGDAEFSLISRGGVVDLGSFQYVLASADADDIAAPDARVWKLVATDKPSESVSAGLNIADLGTLAAAAEINAMTGRFDTLRMGGKDASAAWGRTYGARNDVDNGSGRSYRLNMGGVQVGADRSFVADDGVWHLGVAGSHTRGDADFGNGSSGKTSSFGVAPYASWVGANGSYVNLVARLNLFKNQFDARSSDDSLTHGRYTNIGMGMSAELGRRIDFGDRWFVTPQTQLDMMTVRGTEYTADNGMQFKVGDATSVTVRAGATLGRSIAWSDTGTAEPYLKLAAVMEAGGANTVLSNDNAFNSDINGSRVEIGAGVNLKRSSDTRLDLQLTTAKGRKVSQPWGVSVGYRYSW